MKHFIELQTLAVKDKLPGATAAYFETEHFTLAYTELKTGAQIPLHNHTNEAVDIVLEGELEMQIGDEQSLLKHGMMSFVPSFAFHQAKAITHCKVITVLYPKREL